jgi:hypothetical protein
MSLFWCNIDFHQVSLLCASGIDRCSLSSSHDRLSRHLQQTSYISTTRIYLHVHTSSHSRVTSPYFPRQCSPRALGVTRNPQQHDAIEHQNQARHSSLRSQVTHPIFIYCTTLAPRIFLGVLPSNLIPTGYWLRSRSRNVRRHGHSA